MKKAPLIVIIPALAIVVVLLIAMGIKMFGSSAAPSSPPVAGKGAPAEYPNSIASSGDSGKPSNFMGNLFVVPQAKQTPAPTPVPETAVDMSTILKGTYDDGGQSDLDALAKDVQGL